MFLEKFLDKYYERFYNILYRRIKENFSTQEKQEIRKRFNSGETVESIRLHFGAASTTIIDTIREETVIEALPEDYIQINEQGYVGLVNTFGTELDIVNAARVSYNKESSSFGDRDSRLIKFLLREGHTSPFRHVSATFECYVPLMVARQHWKYAVASTFVDDQNGWNESSRRYITEEPQFYIPSVWRTAPENSKQGSGADVPESEAWIFSELLSKYVSWGQELYNFAIGNNIAPEQARLFLPGYGMMIRYRWTVSLAGIINFLDQRLAYDAQSEIQELARGVQQLITPKFPHTFDALYKD